jgi:hypothetical protein
LRIEHPLWNLEYGEPALIIPAATEHYRTAANAPGFHQDSLSVPWMEPVAHFLNISNMGFSLPVCTTLAGRIALWDQAFLIESNRLHQFPSKLLKYPEFYA